MASLKKIVSPHSVFLGFRVVCMSGSLITVWVLNRVLCVSKGMLFHRKGRERSDCFYFSSVFRVMKYTFSHYKVSRSPLNR